MEWALKEMNIRVEPTESIFGATLGEEVLTGVERYLQVRGAGEGRSGG